MIQWLQVTSGRGPAECCWVVTRVVQCIVAEATAAQIHANVLEIVPGDHRETFKSALIALEARDLGQFVNSWVGTVLWIGNSPFRPHHKRKNWFVGVEVLAPQESLKWSEKDLKFQTMKSSGPGGQHVNTTETAVRVTHLPSGLSAIAQEERSQYLNRKLALSRLARLLEDEAKLAGKKQMAERWEQHNTLERGHAVRSYEGPEFRPIQRH